MRYLRCYHGGVEAIPYITAWNRVKTLRAVPCGDSVYNPFVFFWFNGAGGINQQAAWLQNLQRMLEDQALASGKVNQIGWLKAPFNFRIAAERSGARTGGVHQNAIKLCVKRQPMCGIQHHTRAAAELAQTMQVEVARNCVGTGFDSLQGFIARGGAEIEKFVAGLDFKQWDDQLRAEIHLAAIEKMCLRRKQERFGRGDSGSGTVVSGPRVKEPCGRGQFGRLIREWNWIARYLAEHGIDEAGGGTLSRTLDQLNGFGDGGMGWDAIEVAQLKNAEPEHDTDFRVEFDGAACEVVDQEIELELEAETAEDELVSKAGFLRSKSSGVVAQNLIGPSAFCGAKECIEGDGASGDHGCWLRLNCRAHALRASMYRGCGQRRTAS